MTKTFKLFWIREDGQGDFDMGTYDTAEAAEAAIPGARAELIDQCGEQHQKDAIDAGRWSVQPVEGDDE